MVKGGPKWPKLAKTVQCNLDGQKWPKNFYPNVALKILLTCFGTPCLPTIHYHCWPSLVLLISHMVNTITITITHHCFQPNNKPRPCWSSSPSSSPWSRYWAYNKPWPCWSPKWWTCADFHRGECVAQLGREAGNLNIIDSMVMLQIFCRWPWNILISGLNFQFWFSIFCIVWQKTGMVWWFTLAPFVLFGPRNLGSG